MSKTEETKSTIWTPITCPHCGAQYLVQDIFYPDDFSGKAKTVVKDPLGKILLVDYEEGYEPTFNQKYICDHCDRQFIIEATLSFKTLKEAEELDFSKKEASLLD